MKRFQVMVFVLSIAALQCVKATVFDFDVIYDGTAASLVGGSTTPAGSTLLAGDSFNLDLHATGDDYWSVDSAYADSFPLDFSVDESGTRTADIVSKFFLDGIEVLSITETSLAQSFIHIGAQNWSLAAGLIFDNVLVNYNLLASDTVTSTINTPFGGGIFASFGSAERPFYNSSNISYNRGSASVSEPGILALSLLGFAVLGAGRIRNRRKTRTWGV